MNNNNQRHEQRSRWSESLLACVCFLVASSAWSATQTYSTHFDGVENPISENGAWSHLGQNWTVVAKDNGVAHGTQTGFGDNDDSYARLSGFSSNQVISAVVRRGNIAPGCAPEVELLLRFDDSADSARGYEVDLNSDGGVQFVRWNGAPGDYTVLDGGGMSYDELDGATFKASIIGNVLSVYINDVLISQTTDDAFADGNPGIGFFRRDCGSSSDFGLRSFSATGSGETPAAPPPPPPSNPPPANDPPPSSPPPASDPPPSNPPASDPPATSPPPPTTPPPAPPPPSTTTQAFSTNFAGSEIPLSENGAWSHAGLHWTVVAKENGLAHGTQTGSGDSDDSYARLSGFSPNQTISATVHRGNIASGCAPELELFLRFDDSADSARGYEVDLNSDGGVQFIRWEGPPGSYTVLSGGGNYYGDLNGATFKASMVGNVLSAYVNDVLISQITDDAFTDGNPGIGFFRRDCGSNGDFGFTSVSATGG